ncbi:aminoglycoside phosphotransferase family protein [Rossellomorea vietnamensis]|uniref:aminoglycoside phosphotransferase family protein n=1 Tax=Rossellomorea vietnamensis TaxID=218284 RepID=UPI003CE78199
MDDIWERSFPFYHIERADAEEIFSKFDKRIEIVDYTPINIGCINSNYRVATNKGPFLLRILPLNETGYIAEEKAHSIFYGYINIPELLYVSTDNITKRTCLIYRYIEGTSMQDKIKKHGKLDDMIIKKVAESAALIHNTPFKEDDEGEIYPPFHTWFNLFLNQENVIGRLGIDLKKRVERLVDNKEGDLKVIEKFKSFIHSDFRPANMMIDQAGEVWIVDWEFSGGGHSLADIGQFFRYSHSFKREQVLQFGKIYNHYAIRSLPADWYELSKLRDLVNPLQMLGAKGSRPNKYRDLKEIIKGTVLFFDY